MPTINYTKETPEWIRDWATWGINLLIPDWDVKVGMTEEVNASEPDNKGEVEAYPQYQRAEIIYETSLVNNVDGHERVIHEICHAFFAHMDEAAENLISSKIVKKTAWKSYDLVGEMTVVNLSRLLVSLRPQVVDKKEIA